MGEIPSAFLPDEAGFVFYGSSKGYGYMLDWYQDPYAMGYGCGAQRLQRFVKTRHLGSAGSFMATIDLLLMHVLVGCSPKSPSRECMVSRPSWIGRALQGMAEELLLALWSKVRTQ